MMALPVPKHVLPLHTYSPLPPMALMLSGANRYGAPFEGSLMVCIWRWIWQRVHHQHQKEQQHASAHAGQSQHPQHRHGCARPFVSRVRKGQKTWQLSNKQIVHKNTYPDIVGRLKEFQSQHHQLRA